MKSFYLLDSQSSVRQMLSETLNQNENYTVVGQSNDGKRALEEVERLEPDVIVLEVKGMTLSPAEFIGAVKGMNPDAHLMIYSDEKSPVVVKEILQAGANGYIEKSVSLNELLNCVRIVAEGGCFFGFNITEVIRSVVSDPNASESRPVGLTEREREVLVLIAEGKSNKDIAAELGLSVKTVDNHRCSMMRKLDLHNVASITRYAIEHRMVPLNFVI